MIRIFITGGTIDDLEYERPEDAPIHPPSLIPQILTQANLTQPYSIEVLFQKDSRHVNEKDRAIIANACQSCPEKNILITHGTMTMAETARYLDSQKIDKAIVLVGSMIPANQKNSDAEFNVGAAFSAVQLLPSGVYVVMNGEIFDAKNVVKNEAKGVFEPLNTRAPFC